MTVRAFQTLEGEIYYREFNFFIIPITDNVVAKLSLDTLPAVRFVVKLDYDADHSKYFEYYHDGHLMRGGYVQTTINYSQYFNLDLDYTLVDAYPTCISQDKSLVSTLNKVKEFYGT